MKCPQCRSENSSSTVQCSCGFDFVQSKIVTHDQPADSGHESKSDSPKSWRSYWPQISDITSAEEAAKQGVWASLLMTFVTTGAVLVGKLTGFQFLGVETSSLVDAGLFALIAWGINRNSRFAAVCGLLLYLLEQLMLILSSGFTGATVVTVILVLMYITSIRGTFAYHRLRKEAQASGDLPGSHRGPRIPRAAWITVGLLLVLGIGIVVLVPTFGAYQIVSATEELSDLEAIQYVRSQVKGEDSSVLAGAYLAVASYFWTENVYVKYGLAYTLSLWNQYETSNGILRELVQTAPQLPYVRFSLGYNYSGLGRPLEAVAFLEDAAARFPDLSPDLTFRIHNNLGLYYGDLKEYEKGILSFEKAIEINPGHPYGYQNIGLQYQGLKEWDTAIQYGETALEISSYPAAHAALATAYYGAERYEESIEQSQIAIYQIPSYPQAWMSLASAYVKLGLLAEAEEAYNRCIELDPDWTAAWSGLGWVYYERKDYQKAVELQRKALRFNSKNTFAKMQLQIALFSVDNPERDVKAFEERQLEAAYVLESVAETLLERDFEKAIPIIKKAIELNPYESIAYDSLAFALYYQDDFENAAINLERSLEINPYDALTATNYACTLAKLSRLDEAYQVVRDISLKVPENEEFKQLLGDIQARNVNEFVF